MHILKDNTIGQKCAVMKSLLSYLTLKWLFDILQSSIIILGNFTYFSREYIWRHNMNEIINGMGYTGFIDSQVKAIKREDNIRKKMRIQK